MAKPKDPELEALKAQLPFSKIQPKPPKKRKYRKLEQKTAQQLVKEADKYFSWYIRLRDSDYVKEKSEWQGTCISCPNSYLVAFMDRGKLHFTNYVDNGHFVSRGHKIVRYDEENCNLQCKRCNKWLSGNAVNYRLGLDAKYGAGTADKLIQLAAAHPVYNLTKPYLLQIITDAKTQIAYLTKDMPRANI